MSARIFMYKPRRNLLTLGELPETNQGESQKRTPWRFSEWTSRKTSRKVAGGIPERIFETNNHKNLQEMPGETGEIPVGTRVEVTQRTS